MEHLITILLFILCVINMVKTIGWFIGYQLQIDNPNCKEDVNNVKRNKLTLKIMSIINFLLILIVLILFQVFFV